MQRLRNSTFIYLAIIAGMLAAPIAWNYFDSPVSAAVIALACFAGCELYGIAKDIDWWNEFWPKNGR